MIGIVGGAGPFAGLDLAREVMKNTRAVGDSDHAPLLLVSRPDILPDRTRFLEGKGPNPAEGVVTILEQLSVAGATVCGIACNTMHAPKIMERILEGAANRAPGLQVLSLIEETADAAAAEYPSGSPIGILGTRGTLRTELYQTALEQRGLRPVTPPDSTIEAVHSAIYDPKYGLKTMADIPDPAAVGAIDDAIAELADGGAVCVVLGCTELPLAEASYTPAVPLINATRVLARALIRNYDPSKLPD